MVSGNDKYWFENDDKEKSEVGQGESGIAEENEKEDLFGFDASDTLDSSVTSAPSEKITSPLDSANVPPSDKPVFSAPENSQDFFDSHENHYRSDYARSGIDEADLNGDGKIKAVRGHMLKKLLKYDFRALFKFLVPCYIVLGGLGGTLRDLPADCGAYVCIGCGNRCGRSFYDGNVFYYHTVYSRRGSLFGNMYFQYCGALP